MTEPLDAPEQAERRRIDAALAAAGWIIQDRDHLNLGAGPGVAVREFPTDAGPCDYLLFLDGKPAGVIEAKREGVVLTGVEAQTRDYAGKLPSWMNPPLRPLPFLYESTGAESRFTNLLDPTRRSRRVFSFHQPAALKAWRLARAHPRPARRPRRSLKAVDEGHGKPAPEDPAVSPRSAQAGSR